MKAYFCGGCGTKEGFLHLDNCKYYVKGTERKIWFNVSFYCCNRCGKIRPKMFKDPKWEKFCETNNLSFDITLCKWCFNFIKRIKLETLQK